MPELNKVAGDCLDFGKLFDGLCGQRKSGERCPVDRNKVINEIDEICEAESYDYERIQVIDQHLQDKLKLLNELNESILLLCDVEEITHEIEESEEINDRILSKRKKIETILKNGDKVHSKINNIETQSTGSIETQPTGSSETQPTGSSENQHVINDVIPTVEGQQQESTAMVELPNTNVEQQHSMNLQSTQVNQQHSNSATKPRLPKITLPRFNGEVTKWNTFWDSFNSAIHTNTDIANIDKFNYLKSLIEGPAARAIQGLTLTNDNYETAIKILEERFGKRQQIVSAHMDELLKIPSCTSDKLDTLRLVYDKISVHTRGLATLGISADQYGSLLIPVIMSKLPNEIRLQIARNSTQDVWKIDELLGIIKKEVEAREASERIKADEHVRQQGSKWQGHKPTARSFLSKDDQNYTVRCAYCKELHYSASCTKVTDPEKRQDILRNTNRCFNCLRIGHHVSNCQSSKGCRHCKQKHHQSICNTLKSPIPDNKSDRNKTTEESKGTTTTSNVRSKGTVLLQTARTTATNSNGSRSTKVRVLFDSGSQRSYISNSLKTRLNLKPVKNETLNLNTFGPLHDSAAPTEIQSNLIIPGQSETFNHADIEKAFLMSNIIHLRFCQIHLVEAIHLELTEDLKTAALPIELSSQQGLLNSRSAKNSASYLIFCMLSWNLSTLSMRARIDSCLPPTIHLPIFQDTSKTEVKLPDGIPMDMKDISARRITETKIKLNE
ncbi:PREDICTED: uncharacterized protein LOC107330089, partial [Paramuricea clavata]